MPPTPPTHQELMKRGRHQYEVAEQLTDAPEQPIWWEATARDYDAAFRDAPSGDDAPEAALNGAWAYRQLRQYAKAIALYESFIASYGSESNLSVLQHGDPQAEPPIAANRRKYEEHLAYLAAAREALSETRREMAAQPPQPRP